MKNMKHIVNILRKYFEFSEWLLIGCGRTQKVNDCINDGGIWWWNLAGGFSDCLLEFGLFLPLWWSSAEIYVI